MPHASDCAHWVGEPCDCITGQLEALESQTLGALDVLQLVLWTDEVQK